MIILPFAVPIIACFQHHAVAQSIILANVNSEGYMPWFSDNYIQIKYKKEIDDDISADFVSSYIDFEYPMLITQTLTRSFVNEISSDIVNFIINNLKSSRYVYMPINTSQITAYSADSYHPMLIYGYNESNCSFCCADYFGVTYEQTQISSRELFNSYNNYIENSYWWNGIKLLEYNIEAEQKLIFDFDYVTSLLNNYFTSSGPSSIYRLDQNYHRVKYCYGISIYKRLIADLSELINTPCDYNPIVFSVLVEHKIALKRIIQYGHLFNDESYVLTQLDMIQNQCKILRAMFYKYAVLKSPHILLRCVDLIQSIEENEIELRNFLYK